MVQKDRQYKHSNISTICSNKQPAYQDQNKSKDYCSSASSSHQKQLRATSAYVSQTDRPPLMLTHSNETHRTQHLQSRVRQRSLGWEWPLSLYAHSLTVNLNGSCCSLAQCLDEGTLFLNMQLLAADRAHTGEAHNRHTTVGTQEWGCANTSNQGCCTISTQPVHT